MKTTTFLITLLYTLLLSANGGGVHPLSATLGSSSPEFRDIKDVEIISERLFFTLAYERSRVKVEYLLWNNSDEDYLDIDYGFPIDFMDLATNSEKQLVPVSNISFYLGDAPIEISNTSELIENKDDEKGDALRQWHYTKVSVKSKEVVKLTVTYDIDNMGSCDSSPPYSLLFEKDCTKVSLLYDFSPASHWGNGLVRDFYVEVNYDDLHQSGETDVAAMGLPFEQHAGRLTYRARNFDLKNAKQLFLNFNADPYKSIDLIEHHLIPQNQYTITSTSHLPNYPVSHLSDMNIETAWVSKGTGAQIEIDVSKTEKTVNGFVIIPDYQKNESTYLANNRLKKMTVEVKFVGMDKWIEYEWAGYGGYHSDEGEGKYVEINFSNFLRHCRMREFGDELEFFMIEYGLYDYDSTDLPPLEKFRLTIKEVFSGSKYDDTCISEIMLFH